MISGLAQGEIEGAHKVGKELKRQKHLRPEIQTKPIHPFLAQIVPPFRPPAKLQRRLSQDATPPEKDLRRLLQGVFVRLDKILIKGPFRLEAHIVKVPENPEAGAGIPAAPEFPLARRIQDKGIDIFQVQVVAECGNVAVSLPSQWAALAMGGKQAPAVLGNMLIFDSAISNTIVLVLAQSLVKIGKSDFPPRIPAQNSSQFPKEPDPRTAFHVNSDGGIGALGDGPEKRLLELEALPARRAELGKKKTGLPLGSQREIGVGQVKNGDIHEIEGPASDNRFTFAAQIDLVGRPLPRGRAGLTETGGKKSFIDMIGLPGKFLQPFPAYAEVAGFEKNLALVDRGRSEEHTSELQSQSNIVCRLLLEKNTQSHTQPQDRQALSNAHAVAKIY